MPDSLTPTTSPTRPKPPFAAIALVLVVVVAAIVYFVYMEDKKTDNNFGAEYSDAHLLHHTGDHSQSIEKFRALVPLATNKAQEAHIKAVLAFDLFLRNQGSDRAEAMQIYSELAFGSQYQVSDRAIALAELALLAGSEDRFFIDQYFSSAPLNQFLPVPEGRFGPAKVGIRMLMHSDSLFPNSLAKYSIAGAYANMIGNSALDAGSDPAVIAQLMQEYVRDADPLLGEIQYEKSHVVRQNLYRALALGASNRVLNNISFEVREDAYKRAINLSNDPEANASYQAHGMLMRARFYYAAFLNNFGDKRETDIASLLQPFGMVDPSQKLSALTVSFFTQAATRSDTDFVKSNAIKLAALSAEFKAFLVKIGWTF